MKKIFNLVLLTIAINSFSQTGKVTYVIESLKTDKLESPMLQGIIEEWKQVICTLTYDKNNSYFRIDKNIPIEEKWNRVSKVISETYTDWYQDKKKNQVVFNKEIKGKTYQVRIDRLKGWSITKDTKIIEGYTCYKAIRKELNETSRAPKNSYLTYIAWFTPEIPMSFGPIGNGGLPGLILRLERPNLLAFTAKKIILNKKKVKIKKPKAGKVITMKERSKLMRLARLVTPD